MSEIELAEKISDISGVAYKSVTGIIDDVLNRIERIKNKNLSTSNLLRAYYFEVVNNIEFLSVINYKNLQQEKPNSKIIKTLVDKIETQIGATILFCDQIDEKSELFKLLRNKGQLDNTNKKLVKIVNGKEQIVKTRHFYENILQAISFTVVKTEFLRRLSVFDNTDLQLLNTIQLDTRISNILERFIMIKMKLEELDAISSVAR